MKKIFALVGKSLLQVAGIVGPVLIFTLGFYVGLSKTFMAGHFYRSQRTLYEETYRLVEISLTNHRYVALVDNIEAFCARIRHDDVRSSYTKLDVIAELNRNLERDNK